MRLKTIIGCVLVAMALTVATPALALNEDGSLSFGVSPPQIVLEVPGNGSTTTHVNIHYFSGDVEISLVNIPLRVEPSTIHVEAADNPVVVELTVYGKHALDTQVYDGYLRLIAVSGEAATGGIQVLARITNVADGIAPSEDIVVEELAPVVDEPAVIEEPTVDEPAETVTTPAATETVVEETITAPDKPWLIPVAAGGGGLVLVLIILLRVGWKQGWVA